ncbi:MAG TPA: twin-arginine translocase subunit TatC [Anaerolineae bacterium]|nr:twin-arginine translocase subunit TatC [Anaerolineae bacterium]HOR01169.1 twin-arginine translocase subunit TatC [Anaerolineae bacterium]HPL28637.1 twin-arginine translocase subunit TatC [Anaerolineae bacterium]
MSIDNTTDIRLTIIEHLEELRDRLIVIVIALVVSTAFSLIFTEQLLRLLIKPLGATPIAIHPVESFIVYFKVALIAGVALAMPVILYEIVRFLLPALTPKEKGYLYFLLPGGTAFFIIGLAFATLVMLPAAIRFLHGFMSDVITQQWTIENYINFVTTVLFWMGIIFELPLVMFFLGKLGVVNAPMLVKFRRFWIVAAAVIAAVVTPTPDPVNMCIVMVPLLLLYEIGILLVRLAGGGKPRVVTNS